MPRNGGVIWQVRPGGPLRGAPTVAGDALYVMSQDNQIYSLKTGGRHDQMVEAAASLEIAGVFGIASPAFAQGTVVAGFSSGELNAYRYENGRLVWQDALVADEHPHQRVVAVRHRRRTGDRQRPGVRHRPGRAHGRARHQHRPADVGAQHRRHRDAVGGGRLGVRRDRRCQADRGRPATGKVRWINQLPRFENEKSKRGQITYRGPVLAGGRLILAGSNGTLINVDPDDRQLPEPDQ